MENRLTHLNPSGPVFGQITHYIHCGTACKYLHLFLIYETCICSSGRFSFIASFTDDCSVDVAYMYATTMYSILNKDRFE